MDIAKNRKKNGLLCKREHSLYFFPHISPLYLFLFYSFSLFIYPFCLFSVLSLPSNSPCHPSFSFLSIIFSAFSSLLFIYSFSPTYISSSPPFVPSFSFADVRSKVIGRDVNLGQSRSPLH